MIARAETATLQVVLTVLAVLMSIASRRSARFRGQVTRDLVIEIGSDDGAVQQYAFHARTRTMTAARRPLTPECTVRFASARVGLRTLISRRAVGRVVAGMNDGSIRVDGNAVIVLWFHGLSRVVLPLGRSRVPRRRVRCAHPVPVRAPETDLSYAARIVREPARSALDEDWTAAWAARAKLLQLRGPSGKSLPPG